MKYFYFSVIVLLYLLLKNNKKTVSISKKTDLFYIFVIGKKERD